MTEQWWYALLCKLPTYNPRWPPEIQAQWFDAVRTLRRLREDA